MENESDWDSAEARKFVVATELGVVGRTVGETSI